MTNRHNVFKLIGAGSVAFLAACAPLTNASAHSSTPTTPDTYVTTDYSAVPEIVNLPADATPATGETLLHVMNSTWVPQPAVDGIRVSFVPQGSLEGFRVEGGPCNGYGTAIHPNVETGAYTTTSLPVTRMACDTMAYEGAVTEAFRNGTGFYTVGEDTLYVAGAQGALKLVRDN